MVQPRDFGFTSEVQMLRDTVHRFFRDNFTSDRLHKLVASDHEPNRESQCNWDRGLWQTMVELGWHGLAVPERAGGSDMGMVGITAVAEELGRAAFPSPFTGTVMASLVLAACDTEHADQALEKIVEGHSASLAFSNRTGSWSAMDTEVICVNGKLNGTAWFVQDMRKSDYLVVIARSDNTSSKELGFYLVDVHSNALDVMADSIVDLTRDQAHIAFQDTPVIAELTEPGNGEQIWRKSVPSLLVLMAADMCGAAEWQLQTTAEYAKTRIQFDRPLGFFQAIKHPLVNGMILIDQARSLTYSAACAIDHQSGTAEQCARMAKSSASDMAAFVSQRAIQSHGGIGFTWECFQHIYFKRQLHSQQLMGDGPYQRAILAETLIGPL